MASNCNTLLGLRVFPGPSWDYPDGNFLGTITEDDTSDEKLVRVMRDNGKENIHAIGFDNKFELLIYDSGPIGIKHDTQTCSGCKSLITGSKWGCIEYSQLFICTECYMNDFHIDHHFYRVDWPTDVGAFVGKRKDETSQECLGIFKNSYVEEFNVMSDKKRGTVDSFKDHKNTYRSLALIKTDSKNELKKVQFCYKGNVKIKLIPKNTNPTGKIYRNHLRILGLHPIYNFEILKFYKDDFKSFNFQLDEHVSTFKNGDFVYVEFFDDHNFKLYQNNYGESNADIIKLIGKKGVVTSISINNISNTNGQIVTVVFDNDKEYKFNSKTLFNTNDSHLKIVRICKDENLESAVKQWTDKLKTEKIINICWAPDSYMLDKIRGKVGVIFIKDLPGDLVGVRFKLYPHDLCMFLPKRVCLDIEEIERINETIPVQFDLSIEDSDVLQRGVNLICSGNISEFLEFLPQVENHLLWSKLVISAVKNDNIEIAESLLIKKEIKIKNEYLNKISWMKYDDSNFAMSERMMDLFIENTQSFVANNDGYNLLHLASKNGDVSTVEILLTKSEEIKNNLINSVNDKSGYSSLHYAAENSHPQIIRLLLENKCDIYLTEKLNKFTALHLTLKHYYLESFFCILESLDDLDCTTCCANNDTILHLSASFPSEERLARWNSLLNGGQVPLIEDLVQNFNDFKTKSKSDNLIDFHIKEMPSAALSTLILLKGKNAFLTWINEVNSIAKTPENIFEQSTKDYYSNYINLKCSVRTASNCIKMFYKYISKDDNNQFCEFCELNYASVEYKPCGHKIHCEQCAMMPYKCSKCHQDIEERCSTNENQNIISSDDWDKLSKKVNDPNPPGNMRDWFEFIKNTIEYLNCDCCKSRNWNGVFACGHQLCDICYDNLKRNGHGCSICVTYKEYFPLKGLY